MAAVKISTWNVNSIAARLPLVLRWLDQSRPDVLCMQEIKCVDAKFPAAAFAEAGYQSAVYGQPTYNGVAIVARAAIEDVRRGFAGDDETAPARLIEATVGGIRLINVYIPNGGTVGSDKYRFKLEWMKRLRGHLDTGYAPDAPVLLCGDFNVAPDDIDVHDPDLWRGQVLFSEPERAALEQIRAWGFTDLFREKNPEAREYSWWDYRAGAFRRNNGLRIDHIWVAAPLAARCKAAQIDKEPRRWERPSDHTPVLAEFD